MVSELGKAYGEFRPYSHSVNTPGINGGGINGGGGATLRNEGNGKRNGAHVRDAATSCSSKQDSLMYYSKYGRRNGAKLHFRRDTELQLTCRATAPRTKQSRHSQQQRHFCAMTRLFGPSNHAAGGLDSRRWRGLACWRRGGAEWECGSSERLLPMPMPTCLRRCFNRFRSHIMASAPADADPDMTHNGWTGWTSRSPWRRVRPRYQNP